MKEVRTKQELISVLEELDAPNEVKRGIYFDTTGGGGFALHNEEALRLNRKKYPVYSIVLPDSSGIVITGELRTSIIKEAKAKVF